CLLLASIFLLGCSPLKTSPHDEKHQLELTLHEVQTNLDDLRHDVNCFQTEMHILDGRIKYYENTLSALKNQDLQNTQGKVDQLAHQIYSLEKKLNACEKLQQTEEKNLAQLATHANETTVAFTQFKHRLVEIEQSLASLSKLKTNLESLANHLHSSSESFKIYKVSPGDSLKKIADLHKTSVEKLKTYNHLHQDLIVVGQELKIPLG
ncbi:MAG: LysM peptidoglycan-binding domain-containing protein, partial [Chlamydiales bacterium]|nr:LysM peptidoglycan-binding domain-containing protein [Chlamydiales bacterium]